ncbi:endo-beta-N-acetylglucosaminidase [Mycena albidolilacea]|uniref:Endo-beta-N-acetylglucosaminidase n=1 Tax=Mycena albidolilacea TaxID=1033008 RepID=A0AAD7EY91_9AGAR|nr:endo-beta-N-acetylglucosaminidase [Mycena albidolilacea]
MNSYLIAEGSHRVAVYYQSQFDNSLEANSPFGHYVSPLPLIAFITHLLLAAFHINFDDVSVHLNDNVPEAPIFTQMWSDIAIMQSTGIKVIGMLGGAAPGTYTCLTPELFDTYYPVLHGYIKRYHIDGLDLDVEQDTPLADIVHLINRLKHDFGPGFIITLAPVASALVEGANLSGFDYIELEKQVGNKISWYNAQFYSGFGTFFPDDMYLEIVNFGKGLHPSRLVATTFTSPDEGFGFIDIDSVVSSVQDLAQKQNFKFGGIAGWEYWNSLPGGHEQPYLWAKLMSETMHQLKSNETQLASSKSIQSRVIPRL